MSNMNNLILKYVYFDIDGVMNQYRPVKESEDSKKIGLFKCFNQVKKTRSFSKLIKNYNIDVYIFSDWIKKNF